MFNAERSIQQNFAGSKIQERVKHDIKEVPDPVSVFVEKAADVGERKERTQAETG